jgi:hypothetical protein
VRDRIETGMNETGCEDVDWIYLAVVGSCENGDGPLSFVTAISPANCNLSSKISPFHSYVVSEKSLFSTKESLTNTFVGGREKAILVAIVTRMRTVRRGIVVRIPAEAMYFSFL